MLLRILHITNIWTLLLSTTGLLWFQHYCQDELKSVALFANVLESCCEKTRSQISLNSIASIEHCSKEDTKQENKSCFQKRSCCSDQLGYSNADLDGQTTSLGFVLIPSFIVPAKPVLQTEQGASWTLPVLKKQLTYQQLHYFPPPVALFVAHQSFLC